MTCGSKGLVEDDGRNMCNVPSIPQASNAQTEGGLTDPRSNDHTQPRFCLRSQNAHHDTPFAHLLSLLLAVP